MTITVNPGSSRFHPDSRLSAELKLLESEHPEPELLNLAKTCPYGTFGKIKIGQTS